MVKSGLNKLSLWYLRSFEELCFFWPGWLFCQAILILFIGVSKGWELGMILSLIFVLGMIVNTGAYLLIRAFQVHLKSLEDGPEKAEAYRLLLEIIGRRI